MYFHASRDRDSDNYYGPNRRLIEELKQFLSKHDEEILLRLYSRIHKEEVNIMAAIDDAKLALKQLVDEDGLVIAGLNDLAAKAASGQGVSEADVQSITDGIKAQVASLDAALQAVEPSGSSTTTPAPSPAPSVPVDPSVPANPDNPNPTA